VFVCLCVFVHVFFVVCFLVYEREFNCVCACACLDVCVLVSVGRGGEGGWEIEKECVRSREDERSRVCLSVCLSICLYVCLFI